MDVVLGVLSVKSRTGRRAGNHVVCRIMTQGLPRVGKRGLGHLRQNHQRRKQQQTPS